MRVSFLKSFIVCFSLLLAVSLDAQVTDSLETNHVITIRKAKNSNFFKLQFVGFSGGLSMGSFVNGPIFDSPLQINLVKYVKYGSLSFENFRTRPGLYLSARYNFFLTRNFSLQSEINLVEKNTISRVIWTDPTTRKDVPLYNDITKLGLIELPVLVRASTNGFKVRPYLITGISAGIKLFSKEVLRPENIDSYPSLKQNVINAGIPKHDSAYTYPNLVDWLRFSWLIGTGLDIRMSKAVRLNLEFRYTIDFSNNYQVKQSNYYGKVLVSQCKYLATIVSAGLIYTFPSYNTEKYFRSDKRLNRKLNEYERVADKDMQSGYLALTLGVGNTGVDCKVKEGTKVFEKNSIRNGYEYLTLSYLKGFAKKYFYEVGIQGGFNYYSYNIDPKNNYSFYFEQSNILYSGIVSKIIYTNKIFRNCKYFLGAGVTTGFTFRTSTNYTQNDTSGSSVNGQYVDYYTQKNNLSRLLLNNHAELGLLFRMKNNQLLRLSCNASIEYLFRRLSDYTLVDHSIYSKGTIIPQRISYGLQISYTIVKVKKKKA